VLASGAAGPERRTLRLRLDEVELLPPAPTVAAATVAEPATDAAAGEQEAAAPGELDVDVDAAGAGCSSALGAWLSVKGARRLLCAGVSVEVCGTLTNGLQDPPPPYGISSNGGVVLVATSLRLVAALPEPAFVARALRLSEQDVATLLCTDAPASDTSPEAAAMVGLTGALQPCTVAQCSALRAEAATNWANGQFAFKNKALLELCDRMRVHQGWTSSKHKSKRADGAPYAHPMGFFKGCLVR
jgi:hypothetical protein